MRFTTRRVLKKKSKQAAEILVKHYGLPASDIFLSERGDNYHGMNIRCSHPVKGEWRNCECHWHPLKGTPMTGEVSGYYEPEWDERPTLRTLQDYVMWGDRPATMTDREWARTLRITGGRPITLEEIKRDLDQAA